MKTTRPIRLCRVIARLNVGGPAVHVIQLTKGLDSERFEQVIVTGVEGPHEASMLSLARRGRIEPVIVPELGREISLRDDIVALLKLFRLFRAWRPDLVETHTAKAGTLGRIAAWLAGVPVRVHVFHGHVFHGYFHPAKARVYLAIEQALARITTRIIALGDAQRQELLSHGIGTPERVVSIPLGFDLDAFLAPTRRGRLRQELGLRDQPLIGIVGRLVPIKRHDLLLAVARLVKQSVPDAHFIVVGDGELRGRIEAAAQDDLAGHVHFLGWRDHTALPAVYADLDLLLLTSDNEGMPVSLLEAMAAGTAVVATDAGGVRSIVRHGQTGLLAPRGDAVALAEACRHLLRQPDARRTLTAQARRSVYPDYALSTLLDTMSGFYTSLVRPRTTPEATGGVTPRYVSSPHAEQ